MVSKNLLSFFLLCSLICLEVTEAKVTSLIDQDELNSDLANSADDLNNDLIDEAKRSSDPSDVPAVDKTFETGNDYLVSDDQPGSPLDPSDYMRARDVIDETLPADADDPIFLANGFEGDIDNVNPANLIERNAVNNAYALWPNGVVPYVISNAYGTQERAVIAKAMNEYHTKTCIRFVPRTSEAGYIHIVPGSGCSSSVGRTGRVQSVSLGGGCVYLGIVIHELMHAVGFWHEQSRADRDENIEILWGNIVDNMAYNFVKYNLNQISHMGVAYDTCSVMHYGAYAFSKNRNPTIRTIRPGGCQLGQRDGFSQTDLTKINKLYSCSGTSTGGTVVPAPTTPRPTGAVCNDTHIHCATWAKQGECQKNPGWMLKGCPLSCQECKNECTDLNAFCKAWADDGECNKNPDYMNLYCAKSCKICGGSSVNCQDENKFCSDWAKSGQCTNPEYQDYMKLRCKNSCGLC